MPQDHEPTPGLPIKNITVQAGSTPTPQAPPAGGTPPTGFAPAPSPHAAPTTPAAPQMQQVAGNTVTFEFMVDGKHYKAVVSIGGAQGYSIQMYRNHGGQWAPSASRMARPILGAFIANEVIAAMNADAKKKSQPPKSVQAMTEAAVAEADEDDD